MSGPVTPQQQRSAKSEPYEVRLTSTAERVYTEIASRVIAAEERGEQHTAHHTTLRMIDEVLDVIIPRNPIDRKHALSGNLSNIFRFKKGRIRICWIASSAQRVVQVLFISDTLRKEGDRRDPYEVFGKLVQSGEFDAIFDGLGIKRPERRAAVHYSVQ